MSFSDGKYMILLAAVLSLVEGMCCVIFYVDNRASGEGQLRMKSQPDIASVQPMSHLLINVKL